MKKIARPIVNLTGKKFNMLTVIEFSNQNKNGMAYWKCKCDCGEDSVVRGTLLNKGKMLSCGCLKGKHLKLQNKFVKHNDYYTGYTMEDEEFYFDLEDYEKIKRHYWYIRSGYVCASLDNKIIRMHRFLFDGIKENEILDHINRKRNDNRKLNLRIVDNAQNAQNSSKQSNNTSGYIGVTYDKEREKWAAQLVNLGKNKHLGRFINIEDAITARLKAEKEYFKEYAPQRHLFKEYGI